MTPLNTDDKVETGSRQSPPELIPLLETLMEGVITISATGVIESFNTAAEGLFGRSANEMIGQLVGQLMPADDAEKYGIQVRRLLKTDATKVLKKRHEVVGKRKDGSTFPALLSIGEMFVGGERKFIGTVFDVSERREAQEALRKREGMFRALTENTSDYTLVIGNDGKITYASPAVERTSGYATEEMLGHKFESFVLSDDLEIVREVLDQALEKPDKTLYLPLFRVCRKDGRNVYYEAKITNMADVDGVRGIVIHMRDISERTLMEKAAEEARARTRELRLRMDDALESLRDGFVLFDAEDHLVMCNSAYREALYPIRKYLEPGTSFKDFLNAMYNSEEIIPAEFRTEENFQKRLEVHENPESGPWTSPATNGRWFLIHEHRTQDGGTALIRSDITLRKKAETALLESEEKFRAITENTTDFIAVLDQQGVYKYVSPSAVRAGGAEAENFIGKSACDIIHRDDANKFTQTLRDAWKRPGETVFLDEYRVIFANEVTMILEALFTALPNVPGVEGIVVNARDITARRKAEAELLIAKKEAEASSKAKSEFVSTISHELRTPMNAIMGFAQLLEQDAAESLNENQMTFVDEILNSGQHMLELIGGVLDLAKIESGDISLGLEKQNPKPLIDACLKMISATADQNGITVRSAIPSGDLPVVNIDGLRFKQALLNLLSNAVKYNDPGGEVVLGVAPEMNNLLHISVSDTGPGIPENMRDKVFAPFDRLGAESSEISGTGIGLPVTMQLIESMGGAIGFESVVGKGSTFWINLPVVHADVD